MNKTMKAVTVVTAMALTVGTLSVSAFAAETTKSIDVSYTLGDTPVDPTNPNYIVNIPTGIVFDSTNPTKYVGVDVEMTAAQGSTEIPVGTSVDVSVTSTNGYNVALTGKKDAVDYKLVYGTVTGTGTAAVALGKLTNAAPKLTGTATLQGVATLSGNHTDQLTYTVSPTPAP